MKVTSGRKTCSGCQILVVEKSWIQPRLWKHTQRTKHAGKVSSFGSWFSRTVHRDLDGLVVGGHLHGLGHDRDGDREALPPPAPTHEPEVGELGQLVLHDGGAVPDLSAPVIVIAALDTHEGAVRNLL